MHSENLIELSSSDSETNEPASKKPAFSEDVKVQIDKLIKQIKNVNLKYVVSGKVEAPLIVIFIKETKEKIHFPVYVEERTSIFDAFKVSPFGKGSETVIDTQFRNSFELDHNEFEILNPTWNTFLKEVLMPRIKEEMTLQNEFKLSLHKLLLYKSGSFFKLHRDSEKETGMFGTLVIQLPSKYEGGKLVVKHNGQSEGCDFSSLKNSSNEFSTFFSAFYCDCEHEVLPVINGIRICLVYNMLSMGTNATKIPQLPSSGNIARMIQLKRLLSEWWDSSNKLVYCFDHHYTESSLCFDNLKSTDYEIARLFKNLAKECSFDIMFGLLKKKSSGYGSDFDSNDGYDVEYSLECVKSIDNQTRIESFDIDLDQEVIPDDCFKDVEPDDTKEDWSNTGNCGVEYTRFYNLAAMVLFEK